jgi:hypothetical protein
MNLDRGLHLGRAGTAARGKACRAGRRRTITRMDPTQPSPFLVFTVIAAPAVLTNAASVMSLTTSNRLARAIDRSRAILAELTAARHVSLDDRARKAHQIDLLRQRAMALTRALSWYQLSIASFGVATLVALVGTVLHYLEPHFLGRSALVASLACAVVGVSAISVGALLVVRETRLSYQLLREDTAEVMESLRSPLLTDGLITTERKD